MTSVSNFSNFIYTSPSTVTQGAQSSQVSASDPDVDGDSGQQVKHGGHHHGHGQMQDVLMRALQSLGLDTSQSTSSSATSSTSSSASTSSEGDSDQSSSGTSTIKADIHEFMHALFQAVKAEDGSNSSSSSGTANSSSDQKASFAAGLSNLITQVSNGKAPSDLQSAFSNLVSDLQGFASNGASTSGSSTSSTEVTLQELLSKMQQGIGYSASSTTTLGNVLTAVA